MRCPLLETLFLNTHSNLKGAQISTPVILIDTVISVRAVQENVCIGSENATW